LIWFEDKLKTIRTNNISLFVTVLSACLLAVGTSAQLCAQPTSSVDLASASLEKSESGKKVRHATKRLISQSTTLHPRIEYAAHRLASCPTFTENTKGLVSNEYILSVTRLPRAGIRYRLTEQPTAI